MLKYITQRLVAMVIILFIIVTLAFMVIRLMPGSLYDDPEMSPALIEAIEAKYHLDKPLIVQYGYFLKGIVVDGDWGTSIKIEPTVPVFQVLKNRIPISLAINVFSLFASLPLGIVAGTIAALHKNKLPDYVISLLVILCISIPSFVFASILQYFVAFKLSWAPIIYNPTSKGFAMLYSLMLPILALSFGPIATVTRYLRGELIETLSSEFMLLAKTKGLSHTQATVRHAFRNSCVPLANIIIPMFTNVLGGSLVIERIFAIPGVGGIMIDSINASDHPLTIAVLLFYSVVSLVTVLIVDISYGLIDPRIRMGAKE